MENSTKIILGIIVILVIVLALSRIMNRKNTQNDMIVLPNQEQIVVEDLISPATGFAWRYEKGTEDLDGLPKTRVFLDVTYENKKVISKMIEEVQGSCNAIDPAKEDSDRVSGTTKIQCYAAGFGEHYKIVKGADSYQVMRKHIEEGNPEVAPIDFKYETVTEFSLMQ